MTTPEPPDADQIADLLLPLDGPYPPDQVIEAARTIRELVRRLNHATFHHSALRYPPQLFRAVGALGAGLYGLKQTLTQLAKRLDTFAADPRVGHDQRHDPAAAQLRQAAAVIPAATAHLDAAHETTSLSYDTTGRQRRGPTVGRPASHLPPPAAPPSPPPSPTGTRGRGERRQPEPRHPHHVDQAIRPSTRDGRRPDP